MELIECVTCGSHSFTNGKCDYCGNKYKTEQEYQDLCADDKHDMRVYSKTYCDDGTEAYAPREIFWNNEHMTLPETKEVEFVQTEAGKTTLKVMVWILFSIIWFAVCVFIPPLFLMTICGLIIWVCRKFCKKY